MHPLLGMFMQKDKTADEAVVAIFTVILLGSAAQLIDTCMGHGFNAGLYFGGIGTLLGGSGSLMWMRRDNSVPSTGGAS